MAKASKKRKAADATTSSIDETDLDASMDDDSAPTTLEQRIASVVKNQDKILRALVAAKSVSRASKDVIRQMVNETKELCKAIANDVEELRASSLGQGTSSSSTSDVETIVRRCLKEELKTFMTSSSSSSKSSPTKSSSYADAASKRPPAKEMRSRPSIVISSTDADQTSKDVIESFRKKVSFRDAGFAPYRVHPVSNNKIRVEFDKMDDRDTALRKVKCVAQLTAEEGRQRRPMLILKGISKDVSPDDVIPIVMIQNAEVALAYSSNDDLVKKFVRKNRRDELYNLVIEVSPKVRQAIVKKERLNIEHQRVHAEDFSSFIQCYKCLQFGHIQTKCTSDVAPCAHCASKDHQMANCPVKSDKKRQRCFNCHLSNIKSGRSISDSHSPTSVKDCPIVRQMVTRVNSRTDYG